MKILLDILIVFVLLAFAGICSGLNIAILAIDSDHLRRQAELGNLKAKKVLKFKKQTHLTLVSILTINIAFISGISLILNLILSGLWSLIIATISTVIFAEIVPQAIFNNRPLEYVYKFSWFLNLTKIITYPISKPLEYILNRSFPKKLNSLESRNELGLIISEHLNNKRSELDPDEVEIMQGALNLSKKDVKDIMTPIDQVFSLSIDDTVDQKILNSLKENKFSRIPVFNQNKQNCIGILILKNLFDYNFDKQIKVSDLELYPTKEVNYLMPLDNLFRKFINQKTHMLMVTKKDKIIGIVTIEDLLEEIINHEIEDETDYYKKLKHT